MLKDLGRHSPDCLALRMHALAQNILDLRVAKGRELDTEVRRVKRPILRLIPGEESAFQMNAMAAGATEHMGEPLAMRQDRSGTAGLGTVEGNFRRLRLLLTGRKADQDRDAPWPHLSSPRALHIADQERLHMAAAA